MKIYEDKYVNIKREEKEIQIEGYGLMDDCVKCKELLKTFMKLNCKTYQK